MARSFKTSISIDDAGSAASEALRTRVTGDSESRLLIDAGGKLTWGSGSATGDATLYRSAANALKTDDTLEAALGLITATSSGAPSSSLSDGALAVDTTNNAFYFRSGSTWRQVSGGGSSSITTSDTAPGSPSDGDLWYETDTGRTLVYYADGSSSQWVEIGVASASGVSGAAGKIQFSESNSFASDTLLHWDNTNNRLGVGTASPTHALHVDGTVKIEGASSSLISNNTGSGREVLQVRSKSATTDGAGFNMYGDGDSSHASKTFFYNDSSTPTMTMLPSGNVGIGTTGPVGNLTVKSQDVQVSVIDGGSSGRGQMRIHDTDSISSFAEMNYNAASHRFQTSNTARMEITSAGLVGIGTTSPSYALQVAGQNIVVGDYASMGRTTSGGMAIFGHNVHVNTAVANQVLSTNTGYYGQMIKMYYNEGITFHTVNATVTAGNAFYTGGGTTNEVMRIANDGKVGIGQSSPAYRCDINEDTADAVPLRVEMSSGGTANQYLVRFTRNTGLLTNGIYCDTGAAYMGTPSDERIKRDIATIDPADSLAAITALRPVDYRYITDPDDREIRNGLIAQEVEPLIPAAVHTVMETEPRMETVSVPRVETVVDDDGNETTVPVLDEDGDPIIDEVTQPVLGDDGKRIMDTTGDSKMLSWDAVNAHMIGAIKNIDARLEALEAV